MSFPFEYEHAAPMAFGGAMPVMRSFDESQVVILPVPVDRTTSYVSGIVATRTRTEWRKSSSPARKVARRPAWSLS